jgi:hypothetical protein
MKRAAIILLSVLCLSAVNWRYVGQTKEAKYYVTDARTDRREDGHVRTWEKTDWRDDTEEGRAQRRAEEKEIEGAKGEAAARSYSYSTINVEYDCKGGLARVLQVLHHARDGKVLYSDDTARKWLSPPPASIAEAMMLDACKRPVEMQ